MPDIPQLAPTRKTEHRKGPRGAPVLVFLRLLSGGVFVAFGAGKFINHSAELASFQSYGLPMPEAVVTAIGLLELVGGALLIAGILVRPAALLLAADMVGAIVLSGVTKGELVSLTLAPALLVAMATLLWVGSGSPWPTSGWARAHTRSASG